MGVFNLVFSFYKVMFIFYYNGWIMYLFFFMFDFCRFKISFWWCDGVIKWNFNNSERKFRRRKYVFIEIV